ncbi:MAG: type II toxin-antitoxin system Phd/YefM family antitoxin [Acidimicrobiales bacterium]
MDRIGVRELRQHASRYLDRVARGESLEVTDRGRPVARIVPISSDAWAGMVASGRVTPAADGTDVTDEAPGEYDVDASAVLAEMRANER